MIDREKVIKGLERCKLYNKVNCDKCPYDYNGRGDGKSECTAELASDALAMLKEQEPVAPEKFASWWYVCGACGRKIDYHDRFCRWCGRYIKWE
jgi:hypothetical protein